MAHLTTEGSHWEHLIRRPSGQRFGFSGSRSRAALLEPVDLSERSQACPIRIPLSALAPNGHTAAKNCTPVPKFATLAGGLSAKGK